MYKERTTFAHRSNYGSARNEKDVKYIVLHYTAGDGDTGAGNASYFSNNANLGASAHDFVDDTTVTHSVPYNYTAWSVGGSLYTDIAKTGGGKLYGVAKNANTINIEMCDTHKDGLYAASEKTMENAAILCASLMQRYGIDIDHVIRHFDVTGKYCPAYMMDNQAWLKFKARVMERYIKAGKGYTMVKECYLRTKPELKLAGNRVAYKNTKLAARAKCKNASGYAKFKAGCKFKLVEVSRVGADLWGKMKSGYWVALWHGGVQYVE